MNRFRGLTLACATVALAGLGGDPAAYADDAKAVAPTFACQHLSNLPNAFGITSGDWNRDGRLDLAVSHGGSVTIFLADGARIYKELPEVAVGNVARGIAATDLDADGDLDLAVVSAAKHEAVLLDNDGSGHFSVGRRLKTGYAPFTDALADLDGDGKPDLVAVNETNVFGSGFPGTVTVYFDVSTETRDPLVLQAGTFPSDGQVADFDGRPGLDLAISNWGSGTLSIFLNNGDRTFQPAKQIAYGGNLPYSLYAADFSGDGKMDLAVTDVPRSGVWILDGDGQGGFATRGQVQVGEGVRSVTGGDLDGDGYIDLFTANTAAGTVSIVPGKAAGTFGEAVAVPVGDKPRMVMGRDLDGDGRLDLAVTLAGDKAVALLFQTDGKAVPCPTPERSAASVQAEDGGIRIHKAK